MHILLMVLIDGNYIIGKGGISDPLRLKNYIQNSLQSSLFLLY